jgi:uncharacterized membrane protein
MKQTLGIWKTTILGGIFFLLPFAVVMFLIGQLAALVVPVAKQIQPFIPAGLNVEYVSIATLLAIALLVALCYLAGLVARRSFARRFSGKLEKYLLLLFPRYAILKDQMASNIGGAASRPQLAPVVVTLNDAARIGFEVERAAGGGPVTVFLPGAPDPWQGHVVQVAADRVARLAADFGQIVGVCEMLGRGTASAAAKSTPSESRVPS